MVWMFVVSSSRTTVRRDVTKTRERAQGTIKWKMRQPGRTFTQWPWLRTQSAPALTSTWNFVAELPPGIVFSPSSSYKLRSQIIIRFLETAHVGWTKGKWKNDFIIVPKQFTDMCCGKEYSQLSLNGHLCKTETSVKRTPRIGPCFSLLPLFYSL